MRRLPASEQDIARLLRHYYRSQYGEQLPIDAVTEQHIMAAAHILSEPAKADKYGLWLYGTVGAGKTTLMRAIWLACEWLFRCSFIGWHVEFAKATSLARLAIEEPAEFDGLKKRIMLLLDDVGDESAEVMHYGSVMTPVRDLLMARHELGKLTVVSTNLAMSDLQKRYGLRLRDRVREQYWQEMYASESYRR